MKEKPTQQKEIVGLTVNEARKNLGKLLIERQKVANDLAALQGDKPIIQGISKPIELSWALNAIDEQIIQVREWYDIGLTEMLYDESKRLNTLTKALIGLTAILGILTITDIL